MEFFGIRQVGVTPASGRKLLLTVGLVVLVILVRYLLRALTGLVLRGGESLQPGYVRQMRERYGLEISDLEPRVFLRLTDNWLEMAVRFLVPDHRIREVKDAISRELLAGLEAAGISVASATFEVVGLPPVRVSVQDGSARGREA